MGILGDHGVWQFVGIVLEHPARTVTGILQVIHVPCSRACPDRTRRRVVENRQGHRPPF
jgi:hypothetical protein